MFKKKPTNGSRGFRKRKVDDEEEGGHAVIVKAPRAQKRGAAFSTKPEESDSDDEDRMTGGAVFKSVRTMDPTEQRGGAFDAAEIDTPMDHDQRAILERAFKMQEDGTTNDETKLYMGAAGYKSYVKVQESQIGGNKYTGTKGPIRAPQFVRNSCRFDYQPDICKDYKDTGFCGYGDSCKFMHDRGEYKTGWQLEAEFQRQKERQKEREMLGKVGEDSDEEREKDKFRIRGADEDLPFACHLCRGPFSEPGLTLCGHYFCSDCASTRFREKNSRCPICEKQTYGVLNAAPKLRNKAKQVGGFEKLFETGAAAEAKANADSDDDDDDDDAKKAPAKPAARNGDGPAKTLAPARPTGNWNPVDFKSLAGQ